jgi:hypothetical protein
MTPVRVIGVPDDLIEHGETHETVGLSTDSIKQAVKELLEASASRQS